MFCVLYLGLDIFTFKEICWVSAVFCSFAYLTQIPRYAYLICICRNALEASIKGNTNFQLLGVFLDFYFSAKSWNHPKISWNCRPSQKLQRRYGGRQHNDAGTQNILYDEERATTSQPGGVAESWRVISGRCFFAFCCEVGSVFLMFFVWEWV